MAVAYDAVGPSGGAGINGVTGGTPVTWTHINGGNGILIGVTWFSTGTNDVTAVTYGGVSIPLLGAQASGNITSGGIAFYGLVGPTCPTGSNTVSVTFTNSNSHNMGSISVSGAGSLGSAVLVPGVSVNTLSASMTGTTTGGLIVSVVCQGSHGAFAATSPNLLKFTLLTSASSASDNIAGGVDASLGGGATTTVTWTNAGTDDWGMVAVEVLPPSTAGPSPSFTNAHFPPSFYVKRHHAQGMRRRWKPRQPAVASAYVPQSHTQTFTTSAAVSSSTTNAIGKLIQYGAPGSSGDTVLVGAFLNPAALGYSSLDWTSAANTWAGWAGPTPACGRHYMGGSPWAISSDMTEMINANCKLLISLTPAYNPVSAGDLADIQTFMEALVAAGADCDIALWSEPFYSGLTSAQYIAGVQYYGPTIRMYYPLMFNTANSAVVANNEGSYYPGDAWVDKVGTDYYASGYVAGQMLDTIAGIASGATPPKPFAIWELNGSPASTGQSQANVEAYFAYLISFMQGQQAAGYPIGDLCLFNGAPGESVLGAGSTQPAGIEGGIGNWVAAGNTSIAESFVVAHSGSNSLAITATASGLLQIGSCLAANFATEMLPVTVGDSVDAALWFYSATVSRQCTCVIQWYTSAGVAVSSSSGSSITSSTSAWTQAVVSGAVAPATAAFARLLPNVAGAAGPGEVHYIDDAELRDVEGDNPENTTTIEFGWDYRVALWQSVYTALNGGTPSIPESAGGIGLIGSTLLKTSRSLSATVATSVSSASARIKHLALTGITAVKGSTSRSIGRPITGTVVGAASMTRKAQRALTATTVASAAVTRNIGRFLAGVISLVVSVVATKIPGSVTYFVTAIAVVVVIPSTQRLIGRILAGISTVTGSLARSIQRALSAVIITFGSVVRHVSRSLPATVVSAVTLTTSSFRHIALSVMIIVDSELIRQISKPLTATVAAVGFISRNCGRVLSGALTVTSSVTRKIFRPVTATIVVTASLVRSIMRSIVAVVALTAATVMQKFKQVTLSAVVVVTSSVSRQVGRPLTAMVVTTSSVTRNIYRMFIAVIALMPTFTAIKAKFLTLIATMAVTLTLARTVDKPIGAVVVTSASVSRALKKLVIPVVALTATLNRTLNNSITATVAVSATTMISKFKIIILTAVTVVTASTTRSVSKIISGTVSVTGSTIRACKRNIFASAVVTGSLARSISRQFGTTIVLTGSVTLSKFKIVVLNATAAVSAATVRMTDKILSAVTAVTGITIRMISRVLASRVVVSALVSTGGAVHQITLIATTVISGVVQRQIIPVYKTSVAMTGTVKRKILPIYSTTIIMVSGTTRVITRAIQGTFAVAGQTLRGVGRKLTGTIVTDSMLSALRLHIIVVSTLVSVSSSVKRNVRIIEIVSVALSISLTRFLRKRITVPLAIAASTVAGKPHFMTIVTTITVSGTATAKFLSTSIVFTIKYGLLAAHWVTGQIKKNWRTP